MNENTLKKLIIVLVVIIVIIISVIILLKHLSKNNAEEQVETLDTGLEYEANSNGFQVLNDSNMYFSIVDIVEEYLEILKFDIENPQYTNHYEIEDKNGLANLVLDILDENYVQRNNLDVDNFENYIELMDYAYNVIPVDIKVRYDEENITSYIVNIYIEKLSTNELEEKYYIVRVDSNNSTFSIEPIDDRIENIDEVSVPESNLSIENKIYNRFSINSVTVEDTIKIYMSNFLNLLINYSDIAYQNYIDEEYKENRFISFENLNEYVEKNKEELRSVEPTQYMIEYENSGKKYVVMDQYQNTYEFYETSIMSYKVRMDTYTIISDKFKETYDSSNDQYKVAMNIDKWVQMLNTRDYTHAYEVLDETFRNNNWSSEETFEQYMRENFPLHYDVEYTTYSSENSTYVQQINLTDITGETEDIISLNIIMQLQDNYEFVMSVFYFICKISK